MKREIKSILVSVPLTYLLLYVGTLLVTLETFLSHGKCEDFGPFSPTYVCSLTTFLINNFTSSFAVSIYFFPLYIVIAAIMYFTSRYVRIKKESQAPTTSYEVGNSKFKRNLLIILIIVFCLIFSLKYWANLFGVSFFGERGLITQFVKFERISPYENWMTYKSDMGYEIKYPSNYDLDDTNPKVVGLRTEAYNEYLSPIVVYYFDDEAEVTKHKEDSFRIYGYYPNIVKRFENKGHHYLIRVDNGNVNLSPEEQMVVDSFVLTRF